MARNTANNINHIPAKRSKLQPDWWLLVGVLLLTAFGIIMVFSASQYFAAYEPYNDVYKFLKDQLLNAGVGLVLLLIIFKIKINTYKKISYPSFAILIGLLIFMVIYEGVETIGGAQRWLEVAGFRFQPSELAKLILPLALACWLSLHQSEVKSFSRGFLPAIAATVLTCGLIIAQKDLSSSLVVGIVGFIIMFCAGIKWRYLFATIGGGFLAIAAAIIMEPYRMERIYAWLDPWAYSADEGWQTCQSLLALGSGGLTGVGLGDGGSKWFYLPARHTDFIYSIIGEELGFIGAVIIVVLIVFIIWRGMMIAVKAPDIFTSLLALGLVSAIAIQALLNLGVVTGLLPVTGVTLPFVSYGGTSLVVSMCMVGILLNISCYNKK